jgi:hypothetical protein
LSPPVCENEGEIIIVRERKIRTFFLITVNPCQR